VLAEGPGWMRIEATFNRPDTPFHGILLKQGDRFVETYDSTQWYNIFEMYDRDDGARKGWYCNVTRPAVFADGLITYVDLALDLLVYPDGRQLVLDEDEFAALNLEPAEQDRARQALMELQDRFSRPIKS
jgi:protein associated with RNAse G/E